MRNYRFTLTTQDEQQDSSITVHNPDLVHQVSHVLRLNPEAKEEISLIDGTGEIYYVAIKEISKKSVSFQILSQAESKRELKKQITFYIPLLKNDAMSFMIRKLTELGVQSMQPLYFNRVQKQNLEAFAKQKPRYQKIIQEATEQCEAAVFADLKDPIDFDQIESKDLNIFASERMANNEFLLNEKLSLINECDNSSTIALLVGPEGGLTDEEIKHLEQKNFKACSLGCRLLKAETASIALFSSLNIN